MINSLYEPIVSPLLVTANVYDLMDSSKPIFTLSQMEKEGAKGDSSNYIFSLPNFPSASITHFLKLQVFNAANNASLADNFYWLSNRGDVLAWNESNFYRTPIQQYADFTLLQKLPPLKLVSSIRMTCYSPSTLFQGAQQVRLLIRVENPSSTFLAFFVRLRIVDVDSNEDILPVFFQDNFFSLLPKEVKTVQASYDTFQAKEKLVGNLIVECYNNISGAK